MTLPYTPTLIVNTEMQPTATADPCTKDPILTPKDTLHRLLRPPPSHPRPIAASLDRR